MVSDPIKDLFVRAERRGVTMQKVMLEAGVAPNLAYHWRKGATKSLVRWLEMIQDAGIRVPYPGTSTWEALGEDAMEIFRNAGYQKIELQKRWMQSDAEHIENYKKVYHTLNHFENAKLNARKSPLIRHRSGGHPS